MAKSTTTIEIKTMSVEVPMGGGDPPGYQRQLVEAGEVDIDVRGIHLNMHLGKKAAKAFIRFRNGLRATNPRVQTNADALRWLFEEIADAKQIPDPKSSE